MHEGIGSKAYYGLTPDDVDVVLKLFGFRYGLGILAPTVRYYRRGLHLVADLDAVPDLDAEERILARSIRAWVAIRTLNDPVAILKLRAAFPESRPEPAVSPGLHYRLTLDQAAEAVARAADVSRAAERRPEPPLATAAEPAGKPAQQRATSAARRRTASGGRRRVAADLALVGA